MNVAIAVIMGLFIAVAVWMTIRHYDNRAECSDKGGVTVRVSEFGDGYDCIPRK